MTSCTYQPAAILKHMHWREKPYCLTFLFVIWDTRVHHQYLTLKNLRSANILNIPLPNTALCQRNAMSPNPRSRRKNIFLPLFQASEFPSMCLCKFDFNDQMGEHRVLASKLFQLNTNKAKQKKVIKLNRLVVIIIKQYLQYVSGTVLRCLV